MKTTSKRTPSLYTLEILTLIREEEKRGGQWPKLTFGARMDFGGDFCSFIRAEKRRVFTTENSLQSWPYVSGSYRWSAEEPQD